MFRCRTPNPWLKIHSNWKVSVLNPMHCTRSVHGDKAMSSKKIDQSRRGFLTASLFSREGREQVRKKQVRSGVIPPGLQQPVTQNSCADCPGYCENKCPQKIIKLHSADHDLQGQPYLDFTITGCSFCMECNDACPGLSLQKSDNVNHSLGKASLSHEACYAWNNIICMSCINACEHSLIKFATDRKPVIDTDHCTGCGFCIKICPASAIEIVTWFQILKVIFNLAL